MEDLFGRLCDGGVCGGEPDEFVAGVEHHDFFCGLFEGCGYGDWSELVIA